MDYLIKVKDIPFMEAVEIITGQLKRTDSKIQSESKCFIAGYNKVGISNRDESSGVFYDCHAVLTPNHEKKRQNGRRFKECGEPAFCLTAQDKQAYFFVPVIIANTPCWLKAQQMDNITVEKLANLGYMSKTSFNRSFKK